jgi:helix-turn-helix protein
MANIETDSEHKSAIFFHSALREYGLTPAQRAVFTHVASRADDRRGNWCFESVPHIAYWCRLDPKTVQRELKYLVSQGLLTSDLQPGKPTRYRPRPMADWLPWQPVTDKDEVWFANRIERLHSKKGNDPTQKTPRVQNLHSNCQTSASNPAHEAAVETPPVSHPTTPPVSHPGCPTQTTPHHPTRLTTHKGNPSKVIQSEGNPEEGNPIAMCPFGGKGRAAGETRMDELLRIGEKHGIDARIVIGFNRIHEEGGWNIRGEPIQNIEGALISFARYGSKPGHKPSEEEVTKLAEVGGEEYGSNRWGAEYVEKAMMMCSRFGWHNIDNWPAFCIGFWRKLDRDAKGEG